MTDVDHYIKPLFATNIPKSWVVLAVSSLLGGDRSGYSQTWRRASVQLHREGPQGTVQDRRRAYDRQADLWGDIHKWCNQGGMTFLWVHDFQWTARVSGLLEHLPALGWRLDAFALNPGASWMVWRRGRSTIKVTDLMSVWPHGLDRLGALFGLGRKVMPPVIASWQVWDSYTTRDRDIMVRAVEAYLWWVKENELGTIAVTGNSQAWKAFRRRFLTSPILAHHDEKLLDMERRAMWTGRCEAYWRGSLLREVVDEWDFTMAHNSIAAETALPVYPDRPLVNGEDLYVALDLPGRAVLAEVEVETDVPCVPMEMDGGIRWPVGNFRTVLWSPELRIAMDKCAFVRVVSGWLYRTDPVLSGWAAWVSHQMAADDLAVPLWAKDILKRWSNVLVGRFGMRYPKWRKVGQSQQATLSAATLTDGTGADMGSIVQIGHDVWEQSGWTLPHDHAPAITGYVMSELRARMWGLIEVLPPGALLYMDTDSVLVSDVFRHHMERLTTFRPWNTLRLKRSWEGLSIYGPRQLVTGESVRVSGLPKSADRLGRNEFEGEVIESLIESLKSGRHGEVHSVARQWKIEGEDTRRQGTGFGWTKPFEVNEF